MKRTSRIIVVFTVVLGLFALVSLLSGCQKEEASGGTGQGKAREVVVGTGNAMKNFCFLDENGNLVGYEIDVLHAVDDLLPQYEFTYETAEFRSILVGMDAGKYDLAAHNYARNAERAQKYLYGTIPYNGYSYQICVTAGRTDIQTFKDLEGKIVSASIGSNVSALLEDYNKTAAVPIEIAYGQLDTETWIKGLEEGRYDAYINDIKNIRDTRTAYNNRIDGVGPRLLPGYVFFIFNKGENLLRDDVDKAIETLRETGKLKELSIKWVDDDYTQLVPELEEQRLRYIQEG
jgi:ABC-type amino acid transport substrate-binding protein